MEWIGELERTFATSLYPLRVPIAIGAVIAALAVVLVARRRGWFAAARRHPGRSVAIVIVLAALVGPTAWYLGSPLIIRTALEEPAPTPAATLVPASPAATAAPATAGPLITPTAAPRTLAPVRAGEFSGADEFHFGRGTASLIETAPGTWVVRVESFSVRNGPDLYVYLSPDANGYDDAALELGPLKATDGSFNMAVPAGANVSGIRSVVIWCKQFGVLFAVAPLA